MATEVKDPPQLIEAEAEDMEVEATSDAVGRQSNAGEKREREEGREAAAVEEISKKQEDDSSVEEERLEKLKGKTEGVAAGEKREREEGREAAAVEEISKKQKEDSSVEEEHLEKLKGKTEEVAEMKEDENGEGTGNVSLGPKQFGSSLEMFNYFFKILHSWSTDLYLNK